MNGVNSSDDDDSDWTYASSSDGNDEGEGEKEKESRTIEHQPESPTTLALSFVSEFLSLHNASRLMGVSYCLSLSVPPLVTIATIRTRHLPKHPAKLRMLVEEAKRENEAGNVAARMRQRRRPVRLLLRIANADEKTSAVAADLRSIQTHRAQVQETACRVRSLCGRFRSLTSLDVSGARFLEIEQESEGDSTNRANVLDAVATLTHLRRLVLSRTSVAALPRGIGVLPLETLRAYRCRFLSDISMLAAPTASALGSLTDLDLSYTAVKELGILSRCSALVSLNVQGCRRVTSTKRWLSKCGGLRSLDMGASGITDIGAIAVLTGLVSLSLAGTRVCSLHGLARLKRLEVINLANTPIRQLSALAETSSLRRVNVSDCRGLTNLQPLRGSRRSLTRLNTRGAGIASDTSALSDLLGYCNCCSELCLPSGKVADLEHYFAGDLDRVFDAVPLIKKLQETFRERRALKIKRHDDGGGASDGSSRSSTSEDDDGSGHDSNDDGEGSSAGEERDRSGDYWENAPLHDDGDY